MLPAFIIIEIAKYLPIKKQMTIFKMSKSLYGKSIDIRTTYKKWLNMYMNNKYTFDNIKFVEYLIKCGFKVWNYGLHRACKGGNIECVHLMIKMGAYDWNRGLKGACKGGSLLCAQLMIKMGATDWNWGLWGACKSGNMECVRIMITMGATKCDNCYKSIDDHL